MSAATVTVTSDALLDLLSVRHSTDVFEREIQTPVGNRRMDAFAVLRSWTHDGTIGYEVKTSRADFLRDTKWHNYLRWCEQLYLVAPSGIVDPREVDDRVGLLVSSANGARLYTKKAAPRREVDPADMREMFRAVLITRHGVSSYDREGYWRGWLARRGERQDLGVSVSKRLRQIVAGRITRVETRNRELEQGIDALTHVRKALEELGIAYEPHMHTWNIRRRIEDALAGRLGDAAQLRGVAERLRREVDRLDEIAGKE